MIANTNKFPENATYGFADDTEPNWNVPGEYNQVKVKVTYEMQDGSGSRTTETTVKVTVTQPVTFEFVDDDNNDAVVGTSQTSQEFIKGTSTAISPTLSIPENYELAQGQTLPTSYTLADYNADEPIVEKIHLVQKKVTVDPNNPDTNPDPTNPNWFKEHDLIKDVTRTINYEDLTPEQIAQIPANQKTQTVQLTRTAEYNLATKQIVAKSQSNWTEGTFTGFTPQSFDGLRATVEGTTDNNVPAAIATADTPAKTITVKYSQAGEQVQVQFVDTNDNDKVVGTATESVQIGSTITNFSDVQSTWTTLEAKGYGLADGAKLPTSYKVTNQKDQVITINLVHRTQDVSTTDPQAKETRQLTVNYITAADGGNYQKGQSVADASKLDVYYKRTAVEDLVTKKVTYVNWQWDASQGENGYHVVSGDWGHLDASGNWAAGLPTSWAAVVAKVPTVSGFVTFDKGDWEINKKGGVSDLTANQFTFPTYSGADTTVDGSNSIAYTPDSPVYEGTATHTVYYAPIQEEGRTVTEHFKI